MLASRLNCLLLVISLFVLLAVFPQHSQATHAMGADLTYTCQGSNDYAFTLRLYRDCNGISVTSTQTISSDNVCGTGSGSFLMSLEGPAIEVSPLCPSQLPNSACSGGALPGVEEYIFVGSTTLNSTCSDWTFAFRLGNRNSAITTISAPAAAYLYVDAHINNTSGLCNNSPTFTNYPVPYVCLNDPFTYNHGAVDPDGDSLVYSLVDALDDAGTPVSYIIPYSGTNPLTSSPTVSINSQNGTIDMNPGALEVGVMAVRVDEYRNGIWIGSVLRDIQVNVLTCTNTNPNSNPISNLSGGTQISPTSVEVCVGSTVSFDITGTDPDGDNVMMSWNGGIASASFTTSGVGALFASATFDWTPTSADLGFHSFTVSLTDDACPIFGSEVAAFDVIVTDATTATNDTALCSSQAANVQLSVSGGTAFTWNVLSGTPGSLSCTNCSNPTASPSTATVYEVVSNISGGCPNRDTVEVEVSSGFSISSPSPVNLCTIGTGSISLEVTPSIAGSYTYAWSPGTNLSDSTISNPIATLSASASYQVTVSDQICTESQLVDVVHTPGPTIAPLANPDRTCSGSPVMLYSNMVTNSSCEYTVSNITYNPAGGSGTTVFLSDDDISSAIPIGFTFEFYCNTYTSLYINSNGMINFDGNAAGATPLGIPNAITPDDFIALCWDDLNPSAGGGIQYYTLGTAPNRQFVVAFVNVPYYLSSSTISVQVILYEGTNVIEIHNEQIQSDGGDRTQGIENSDGSAGLSVPGRNLSNWIANADAYRFSPVTPDTFVVNWQSPLGTMVGTGDSLSVSPSAATTYYAVATDSNSCEIMDSVQVEINLITTSPDQIVCSPNSSNPVNISASYFGNPTPASCQTSVSASCGSPAITQIGTPDGIATTPSPFYGFWHDARLQILYQASELTAAGLSAGAITQVGFSVSSKSSFIPYSGFTVRMGCTTESSLSAWQTVSDVVYGPNAYTSFIGWNDLPLDVPYVWDGTSNLIIEVCYDNSSYTGNDNVEYSFSNFNSILFSYADNAVGCALTPISFNNTTRPLMRFGNCPTSTVTYAWSPTSFIDDPSIATPGVYPSSSTTYMVTVDDGSCTFVDSVHVEIDCPLPLAEISLEGEVVNEWANELRWTVEHPGELSNMVLERAHQKNDFSAVYAVSPQAQSSTNDFAHVDQHGFSSTLWYRLVYKDLDGNKYTSNTLQLNPTNVRETALIGLYPNPNQGSFHIEMFLEEAGEVLVSIFDLQGKLQLSQRLSAVHEGTQRIDMNAAELPSGTYIYRVEAGEENFDGKLVITK